MSNRLKGNLKWLSAIIVAMAVISIWVKPFSEEWWFILIGEFVFFIVYPNTRDFIKAIVVANRSKKIYADYCKDPALFQFFINQHQPFWGWGNHASSDISMQFAESLFLNYFGPRRLPDAVKGLWEDWIYYNQTLDK